MRLRSARKQAKRKARDPQRVQNRLEGYERHFFAYLRSIREGLAESVRWERDRYLRSLGYTPENSPILKPHFVDEAVDFSRDRHARWVATVAAYFNDQRCLTGGNKLAE